MTINAPARPGLLATAPSLRAAAALLAVCLLGLLALLRVAPVQAEARPAAVPARPLLAALQPLAPDLDPQVLAMALTARSCAQRRGLVGDSMRLAVIDYRQPSTQRRLWVFDLAHPRLLFDEYVAHGRGSGDNAARSFSNEDGSHSSSLGLFATAETYQGGNGYSLRMDGLEPGFNDRARERAIVMHGAWYVDPVLATRQGRLGRSYGCPALRPKVAQQVIDTLKQGQVLFAYYPDPEWLQRSSLLRCRGDVAGAGRPRPGAARARTAD